MKTLTIGGSGLTAIILLLLAVFGVLLYQAAKPQLELPSFKSSSSLELPIYTSFSLNGNLFEWGKGTNFSWAGAWEPKHDTFDVELADGEIHLLIINHETDDGKCAIRGSLRLGSKRIKDTKNPDGPCDWRIMKDMFLSLVQQLRDTDAGLVEKFEKHLDVLKSVLDLYLG